MMVRLPSCVGVFLASVLLVLLSEARGDCGRPETFPNSELRQDVKESYPVGTRLTYYCIPGYEPTSVRQLVIECLDTSQWSPISVSCQRRRCRYPDIENGGIKGDSDLLLGEQITFVCYEGYRLVGRSTARCVLQNRMVIWDTAPPHCERIPCLPPPDIVNGSHNGQDNYVYGSAVIYRCNTGFSLIGNNSIVCISGPDENGMWSGSAPECKVVNCNVFEIPNGEMVTLYRPSYTYEDRIQFRCKPGFKLKNNRGETSCEANSRWQLPLPECIQDIRPTASTGGDKKDGTSAGGTQPPALPTDDPAPSTAKNLSGNNLGQHPEEPEVPTDEPGCSVCVHIGVGAAVAVIAVVAIIVAALIYRAHHKRRGKTNSGSAPESYTAVPLNTDISLKEKA